MGDVHILNGDALTSRMHVAGYTDTVVMRECLVDGPVNFTSYETFWDARANYLSPENTLGYYDYVVAEMEKIKSTGNNPAICLWFEDDLFCQANMWFVLYYLSDSGLTDYVYRVFPKSIPGDYRWGGFGQHSPADLEESYRHKVRFTPADIVLGRNLWLAYAYGNFEQLKTLARTATNCFRELPEVVQAHIDRFPQPGEQGRPEKMLQEIKSKGFNNFNEIFREFYFNEGGIYGFGDVQVKKILEKMS